MTYHQAVNVLDQVRQGADYPEKTINAALAATGDLEPIEWPLNIAVPLTTYKEVA